MSGSRQFQFAVQKAFMTTPISYLLEKQAPHGVLEKFTLHLDWCTSKGSKEFQLVWKRGFQREAITRYAEDALFEVLVRRVFHHYPLIFSNYHVRVRIMIIRVMTVYITLIVEIGTHYLPFTTYFTIFG